MLTWGDKLSQMVHGKAALLSIATNGLDYKRDRLLGVWLTPINLPDMSVECTVALYQKTTGEDLQKSRSYHGISEDMMAVAGLGDEHFSGLLIEHLMQYSALLTYNTTFMSEFLYRYAGVNVAGTMLDSTVFYKACKSRMAIPYFDLLAEFYAHILRRNAGCRIGDAIKSCGFSREALPGHCPASSMQLALAALWQSIGPQQLNELDS